jgi:chaperonin GroEL (HSP60 family)
MITGNTDDAEPKGINILNGLVPPVIETKGKTVEIVEEEKFSRVITPVSELKVYDHRQTKEWALRLASEAAITILRIDQIIVAKPAGGPKPQQNKNWDNDD